MVWEQADMSEVSIVGKPATHDLIAVGASAGGLQALQLLLRDLPADLPAAVLVVQHIGTSSWLAEILARSGALPVKRAKGGEEVTPGQVYVAVPGMHLLVQTGISCCGAGRARILRVLQSIRCSARRPAAMVPG